MNEVVDTWAIEAGVGVGAICARAGMSRQNYYKARRFRQRQQVDEDLVIELVKQERRLQPRLGARKLLFLLQSVLDEARVSIGRDRFFGLLARHDLLVARKPSWPKTTNSRHSLPVFLNLIKELKLTGPNQAWASDVTYIRTEEGFVFASLITDMYSRKVVGFHVGDTLESIGCQLALKAALAELPVDSFPVHHSDRGCQYCCHEYVNLLRSRGLSISMTQQAHCYENALAERLNGILKQEYEMDRTFQTKAQAFGALAEAVVLYNTRRPHLSLNYQTPEQAHRRVA